MVINFPHWRFDFYIAKERSYSFYSLCIAFDIEKFIEIFIYLDHTNVSICIHILILVYNMEYN